MIKHTHTVYKIIGGKKEDNDHKHKGEVIHKHIHGGHVDHVHKHDGHGQHDHKHHGHAEHGHTHHGHNEHKHAHALHGVHDHKHQGHAEHGHKHQGQAQHGHTHGGQFQGSHKHTGHGEHDHKHYGHHDHKHGHHVHSGGQGANEFNSRAFQSLAPAPAPVQQYETYEYLDDIPQLQGRGLQAYYADPYQGYSRIGREAAHHHLPRLGAELFPNEFLYGKNPFPYNSDTYARYFKRS